jgi:predicted DNA-binding protein
MTFESDLHLRVPKTLLERIDDYAQQERRTRGDTVRLILEDYFNSIDRTEVKTETQLLAQRIGLGTKSSKKGKRQGRGKRQ